MTKSVTLVATVTCVTTVIVSLLLLLSLQSITVMISFYIHFCHFYHHCWYCCYRHCCHVFFLYFSLKFFLTDIKTNIQTCIPAQVSLKGSEAICWNYPLTLLSKYGFFYCVSTVLTVKTLTFFTFVRAAKKDIGKRLWSIWEDISYSYLAPWAGRRHRETFKL